MRRGIAAADEREILVGLWRRVTARRGVEHDDSIRAGHEAGERVASVGPGRHHGLIAGAVAAAVEVEQHLHARRGDVGIALPRADDTGERPRPIEAKRRHRHSVPRAHRHLEHRGRGIVRHRRHPAGGEGRADDDAVGAIGHAVGRQRERRAGLKLDLGERRARRRIDDLHRPVGRRGIGLARIPSAVAVEILVDRHLDRVRRVGIDLGVVGDLGRARPVVGGRGREAAVDRGLEVAARGEHLLVELESARCVAAERHVLAADRGHSQLAVAAASADRRVRGAAVDHVGAEAAEDRVVVGAPLDPVVTVAAVDHVVAVAAVDAGVAPARDDPVAAGAAEQEVVARARHDLVGVESAIDEVRAGGAGELVGAVVAEESR